MCATPPGHSSSRRPSRRPTAPRHWRPCGIWSSTRSWWTGLRSLSLYARKGMTDRGLKIRESALNAPTPIIPIYTYETYHTLEVAKEIYDRGVYVNPTLPPATPEGEALLRTSYMATHTEALLDEAMDIMAEVLVKHE